MLPYIITFGISYSFCAVAEYNLRRNRKKRATLFLLFSVLVVSILAGCRDINIGSDTISYTTYFFDYVGLNFSDFRSYFHFYALSYEPGFVVFEFVLSQLFNDSHWLLFWAAMVIYGFTLKSLLKYKDQCSVSLVWILFLALTCTEAFNIIRQYMAMAVGMYGFTYAMEKKYKRFIAWTVLAMSFHYGALIYILIYFIYLYLQNRGTGIKPVVVVFATIFALLIFPKVTGLFNIGLISMKVSQYTNEDGFSFQINPFLIRLPFLIYILLRRRLFINGEREPNFHRFEHNHEGGFFLVLLIVELILSQARGINTILYRFTSFLVFFKFIAYSRIVCLQKGANRLAMQVVMWIYMAIIFVYWVAVLNSAHVYPYTSEILGIG